MIPYTGHLKKSTITSQTDVVIDGWWINRKIEELRQLGYSELDYFIQNEDCNQIEIRNGKYHGVYSTDLLETVVIPCVTDVGLKLITYDCPLRLHYKYGIFDVYSLVAPRVTTEDRFYLRV